MKKRGAGKTFSMGRQASFDWQVREDAAQGTTETVAAFAAPRTRHRWATWTVSALVAVVVIYFTAPALLRRVEERYLPPEDKDADAVLLEEKAYIPNIEELDSEIADEWGDGVTLIELHMDMALVDMVIKQPSEAWYDEPYRVARVLQQDGRGWQPIAPAMSFWSDRRTLATDYFTFDYSSRDEQAVQAIATALDADYLRLHEDLGLPKPVPGARLPIKIAVVQGGVTRVTDLTYSGDTLIFPPPALIPRPLDMDEAEALRQTITYALAVKLFTDSQARFPAPCTWVAVAEGAGLWLRWEGHSLPSRRRWIYESTIQEWSKPAEQPRLADLLSFPLNCNRPPTMLEAEVLNSGRPIPRPELASTLIEYMVQRYGRAIVPTLLRGLADYRDWDDLAQRMVGRSAAELEAGWQAYLQEMDR